MNIHLNELPARARPDQIAVMDSEWFGMDKERLHRPITGRFACLTMCYVDHPEEVYYIDNPARIQAVLDQVELADRWGFHTASFDLVQFRRHAHFSQHKLWDVALIEKGLYSGYYSDFSLKDLVRRYLRTVMHKEIREEFATATEMTEERIHYACLDASLTAKVIQCQQKVLNEKTLWIQDEVDVPAMYAIMDFRGFTMDQEAWRKMAVQNQAIADKLYASFDFNPNSHPQTLAAYRKAGLKLESTGAKAVAHHKDHPLVKQINEYRSVAHDASTYGLDFLRWVEADGRIHSNYKVWGAVTSRTASDDPAMQNIPKRDCFRRCFIAAPGQILIKGDYQAQEPRILAYRSQDKNLLKIIESGGDIHTETARLVYHDKSIVKSDIRRKKAKAVGLGLDYGLTYRGLMEAKSLTSEGIYLTEDEARATIQAYFDAFPGVQDSIWDDRKFAKEHEYVETVLGRRLWVDLYDYKGMNNAINSPVQGTGGDITKLALAELHRHWVPAFGSFGVVETTHDSISIEVPEEMKCEGEDFLRSSMLTAAKKVVKDLPFMVDVTVGKTWGEDKDD